MAREGMKIAATAAAFIALAAPAFAADLGDASTKDTPSAADKLSWTINAGVTSDYIFRGTSQNGRNPTAQGGLDISYGIFYAGTFFSGVKFGAESAVASADVEVDAYAGVKPKWGDFTFDFGIITYNYLNTHISHFNGKFDPSYQEIKAGASVTILNDLALSGTVYYSWDYFGETGGATTIEGTASKPIAKIADVDLAASGTVGHTFYSDSFAHSGTGFRAPNFEYTYGNVGLTATYKAVSLDVRWWDTDLPTAGCGISVFQCGSAVSATFKVTY